jgi:serine protease Do
MLHARRVGAVLVLIAGAAVGGGCAAHTPAGGDGQPHAANAAPAAVHPGFRTALESVVRIDVREQTFVDGSRRIVRGVGSGVILTADGHILTNAHVVNPESFDIRITLPSLERVAARLVGWDHWTDLALLQLDMEAVRNRRLSFAHAAPGDSTALTPGQTVYALGTPNGLTRTVTRGIISNASRYFAASNQIGGHETGYFNNWLQTDAAINPGNSGGPLVNERGEVVGINTSSYLGANNLSFAVPFSIAAEVMSELLAAGRVTRSYIGIRPGPLQDLESFFGLEANEGLLIESVDPGSPAAVAGLRAGDILLDLNGEPLDGRFPEQLPPILNRIARFAVGSELVFSLQRNNGRESVALTTEQLESRIGRRTAYEDWGLSAQALSRSIVRERQLPSSDGVLVLGVQSAMPAAEAGLSRGDVLLSVNRQPIRSLDDLESAYAAYRDDPQRVLFEVMRQHQVSFLVLRPPRN